MNDRILAAFLSLAPLVALGAEPSSVAVLPLQNLSAAEEGPRELAPLLAKALEERGWHAVAGDAVEQALDDARVRYLDSLDASARPAVASALGVGTLALGTVYGYEGADQPSVGVSLRLVSADGRVLFDELAALHAVDTEGLFEFGKTVTREELAREAVERIARRLPRPGAVAGAARRRGKPMRLAAPATYRSAALAAGVRHRVAILPFANAAFAREAPRVAMTLLARRLSESPLFDAVEAADLRAGLVAEKVRDYSDPEQLKKLGARLGTTLFLSGTLFEYVEAPRGGNGTPRLEIALTLTDVASGAVVWTSYAERRGSDYRGLLELGAITSIAGLVDQVSYEMVHAVEKARSTHDVAPSATKTSGPKQETRP